MFFLIPFPIQLVLRAGMTIWDLTYHKNPVGAVALHPKESIFFPCSVHIQGHVHWTPHLAILVQPRMFIWASLVLNPLRVRYCKLLVVRVNTELLGEDVDIYNDLCYIWQMFLKLSTSHDKELEALDLYWWMLW